MLSTIIMLLIRSKKIIIYNHVILSLENSCSSFQFAFASFVFDQSDLTCLQIQNINCTLRFNDWKLLGIFSVGILLILVSLWNKLEDKICEYFLSVFENILVTRYLQRINILK